MANPRSRRRSRLRSSRTIQLKCGSGSKRRLLMVPCVVRGAHSPACRYLVAPCRHLLAPELCKAEAVAAVIGVREGLGTDLRPTGHAEKGSRVAYPLDANGAPRPVLGRGARSRQARRPTRWAAENCTPRHGRRQQQSVKNPVKFPFSSYPISGERAALTAGRPAPPLRAYRVPSVRAARHRSTPRRLLVIVWVATSRRTTGR